MEWTTIPHFVQYTAPLLGAVQPPTWGELGVYFAAALALIGAGYTATVTRRNGREANAITAAEKAWIEMRAMRAEHKADRDAWEKEREEDRAERERDRREREELRKKFDTTTRLFSMSVGYIEKIIRHIRSGGGEPLPDAPDDLRDYLAHIFEQAKEH